MVDDESKSKKTRAIYYIGELYERITPYKNLFDKRISSREKLINSLYKQSKQNQIETILNIWRIDEQLELQIEEHEQTIGIVNIPMSMIVWKPFGGKEKFRIFKKYHDDYSGKYKDGISLLDNLVKKVIIGNIQSENPFEVSLVNILGIKETFKTPKSLQVENLTYGHDVNWKDIRILFVSDDSVRLIIKPIDLDNRYTYAELGFKDERKGDLPNQLWDLLQKFAIKNGLLENLSFIERGKLEKDVSRLRGQIRKIVGLGGDPIPLNRRPISYKTAFKIQDKRGSA